MAQLAHESPPQCASMSMCVFVCVCASVCVPGSVCNLSLALSSRTLRLCQAWQASKEISLLRPKAGNAFFSKRTNMLRSQRSGRAEPQLLHKVEIYTFLVK